MDKYLKEILEYMVRKEATDLHLAEDSAPKIRIDELLMDSSYEVLNAETIRRLVYSLLPEQLIKKFEDQKELDFSFGLKGLGRFRMNLFYQRDKIGAAIRALPEEVGDFEELGLPFSVMNNLIRKPKGLILITGATGSGKSTTLASMIKKINQERRCHIVTIEDPIEYIFHNKKALIDQREVGRDTYSFTNALKYVLRQDPDVILIGELRDLETIEQALNIAETGHLVFSTLHTSDTVQTVNRIIDVFPEYKQQQVRMQLSFVLLGVIGQQLIPKVNAPGRVLATEVLVANHAVRSMIREEKTHQIYSVIQTNKKEGMKTMNQSLYELYQEKEISYEDAITRTLNPEELKEMIEKK